MTEHLAFLRYNECSGKIFLIVRTTFGWSKTCKKRKQPLHRPQISFLNTRKPLPTMPPASLSDEATRLSPLFTQWFAMCQVDTHSHELGREGLVLFEYDVVGAFILSYLALRKPNKWIGGVIKQSVVPIDDALYMATPSCSLSEFPGLLSIVSESYVARKLCNIIGDRDEITIMSIFNHLNLAGIKKNTSNFINDVLVKWAMSHQHSLTHDDDLEQCNLCHSTHDVLPYCALPRIQLLTSIPYPMEVLRMQASNSRVVTMMVSEAQLSSCHVAKLTYMAGMHNHSRDPFEFLLHDLKHMSHFRDPPICREQLGFFKCILSCCGGHPKRLFKMLFPRDTVLWSELEYLISDMNCYSSHLMKYLLAKVLIAEERSGHHYQFKFESQLPIEAKNAITNIDERIEINLQSGQHEGNKTISKSDTKGEEEQNDAHTEMLQLYNFLLKWLFILKHLGMMEGVGAEFDFHTALDLPTKSTTDTTVSISNCHNSPVNCDTDSYSSVVYTSSLRDYVERNIVVSPQSRHSVTNNEGNDVDNGEDNCNNENSNDEGGHEANSEEGNSQPTIPCAHACLSLLLRNARYKQFLERHLDSLSQSIQTATTDTSTSSSVQQLMSATQHALDVFLFMHKWLPPLTLQDESEAIRDFFKSRSSRR
jgi:hypothetical protein